MDLKNEDVTDIANFLFDENDDGAFDHIVRYRKDSCGRITEICLDYNNDNVIDSRICIEYNREGKIYKIYKDKNCDGKIDSIETYEYDSMGNKTVYYDDNADGKTDYVERINEYGSTVINDVRDFKQRIKDALKDMFKK